jgi:hypothetical protein
VTSLGHVSEPTNSSQPNKVSNLIQTHLICKTTSHVKNCLAKWGFVSPLVVGIGYLMLIVTSFPLSTILHSNFIVTICCIKVCGRVLFRIMGIQLCFILLYEREQNSCIFLRTPTPVGHLVNSVRCFVTWMTCVPKGLIGCHWSLYLCLWNRILLESIFMLRPKLVLFGSFKIPCWQLGTW